MALPDPPNARSGARAHAPAVRLRAWMDGDEDMLVQHFNDLEVTRFLGHTLPTPYTREHAAAWVSYTKTFGVAQQHLCIIDELTGDAVGGIGIETQADVFHVSSHRAEVSFWLGRAARGKGVAARALELFLHHVWSVFPCVTRLASRVVSTQGPAKRVLDKAGFAREGTLRGDWFRAGELRDVDVYALLKDLSGGNAPAGVRAEPASLRHSLGVLGCSEAASQRVLGALPAGASAGRALGAHGEAVVRALFSLAFPQVDVFAAEPKAAVLERDARSIFVYGTLRPDCGQGGDVWGVCTSAASPPSAPCRWTPGTVTGFALKQHPALKYPYAVKTGRPDDVVHGAVLCWGDDDTFYDRLQVCDLIEGYNWQRPDAGLYQRAQVSALTAGPGCAGSDTQASPGGQQVYMYYQQNPGDGHQRSSITVADGDWLAMLKSRGGPAV